MSTEFPYRPLGPKLRSFWSVHSTWIAADHLLVVANYRFTESYRRLYFRDIQAITLRRGARWVVPMWWTLAAVLLLIVRLISSFRPAPGWSALSSLSGIGLIAVIGYIVYAAVFRSCTMAVQTAIGQVYLRSAARVGPARRVLEELTREVSAIQGELPPDWTEAPDLETGAHPALNAENAEDASTTVAGSRPLLVPLCAFGLILLDAVFSYLNHEMTGRRWLSISGLLITLFATAFTLAALVQLRPWKSVSGTLTMLWIVLGVLGTANWGSQYMASMAAPFGANIDKVQDFFFYLNEVGEIGPGIAGIGWLFGTRPDDVDRL